MRVEHVVFTEEQKERIGEIVYLDTEIEGECNILELNRWDINDMNKCLTEYLNKKGNVFDTSINTFEKCSKDVFIISYILCKYPNMADAVEYDIEGIYPNYIGYTARMKSTRDELKKFLDRFSYYDQLSKSESHVELVDKYFFFTDNDW